MICCCVFCHTNSCNFLFSISDASPTLLPCESEHQACRVTYEKLHPVSVTANGHVKTQLVPSTMELSETYREECVDILLIPHAPLLQSVMYAGYWVGGDILYVTYVASICTRASILQSYLRKHASQVD